jgi:hypothetical protein
MARVGGVVLAVRPGAPGESRVALGRRWLTVALAEAGWLYGASIAGETDPRAPDRLIRLRSRPWPSLATMCARAGTRSAWGTAEAWLWRTGLPAWQVLVAARARKLFALLRATPPAEVWAMLADPFGWAVRATHPAVAAAPFGVIDVLARRLRPVLAWPESWRRHRAWWAWRVALETELRRDGLRPVDPSILVRPARVLAGTRPDEPDPEPPPWEALGLKRDAAGRWWPPALRARRAAVFARLAANQRALWSAWPGETARDPVLDVVGRWTISAITGPAGSGKTQAARRLIAAAQASGWRVAVAALTGRAAAVLGEGALTLHRLLRYGPWGWGVRRLAAELVVVDEASMLTWDAAAAILEAAPGRVVFVGDPGQLPPVSGEAAFMEILARVPAVQLTTVRRRSPGARARVVVCDAPAALVAAAVETVRGWLRRPESWQVLSPYRRGPCGVDRLNRLLQEIVNPRGAPVPGTPWRLGDRVMLTRPVPACGAPNGLAGLLARADATGVWMRLSEVEVGPIPADAVELAYALTIHRAQGSEWDRVCVLYPLTQDRGFIDARMRYVGCTRSRLETRCLML